MKLSFFPMRMDTLLTAHVDGDVLTLNGVSLDFGNLPSAMTMARNTIESVWIAGDVIRDDDGVLHVPLILPHGANAPEETLFPKAVEVEKGEIEFPPYDRPPAEEDFVSKLMMQDDWDTSER